MPRSYVIRAGEPPVSFVTLAELAWACDQRAKNTLLKLIVKGQMPDANYRLPRAPNTRGARQGEQGQGDRLYSEEFLLPRVVAVFKGIRQGKSITAEQKAQLFDAFLAEKEHYTPTT